MDEIKKEITKICDTEYAVWTLKKLKGSQISSLQKSLYSLLTEQEGSTKTDSLRDFPQSIPTSHLIRITSLTQYFWHLFPTHVQENETENIDYQRNYFQPCKLEERKSCKHSVAYIKDKDFILYFFVNSGKLFCYLASNRKLQTYLPSVS